MPVNPLLRRLLAVALLLAVGACSDDGPSPDDPGSQRPEDELRLLRLAAGAPLLEEDSISFWAFRGESVEQKLYFLAPGGGRGDEYLSLKLEDETLRARPDGTPFAEGDSVLITIKAVDPTQVLFELEPTGLQFSSSHPAELKIRYAEADPDLNDDGEDDEEDDAVELRIGIWRQEQPGDPFVRLGTARVEELKELEAELTGFSRYAIAY